MEKYKILTHIRATDSNDYDRCTICVGRKNAIDYMRECMFEWLSEMKCDNNPIAVIKFDTTSLSPYMYAEAENNNSIDINVQIIYEQSDK